MLTVIEKVCIKIAMVNVKAFSKVPGYHLANGQQICQQGCHLCIKENRDMVCTCCLSIIVHKRFGLRFFTIVNYLMLKIATDLAKIVLFFTNYWTKTFFSHLKFSFTPWIRNVVTGVTLGKFYNLSLGFLRICKIKFLDSACDFY